MCMLFKACAFLIVAHANHFRMHTQMFVIGMSVSFVLFVSLLHIIGKVRRQLQQQSCLSCLRSCVACGCLCA